MIGSVALAQLTNANPKCAAKPLQRAAPNQGRRAESHFRWRATPQNGCFAPTPTREAILTPSHFESSLILNSLFDLDWLTPLKVYVCVCFLEAALFRLLINNGQKLRGRQQNNLIFGLHAVAFGYKHMESSLPRSPSQVPFSTQLFGLGSFPF